MGTGIEGGGEVGDGAVEVGLAAGDAVLGVEVEDGEEGAAVEGETVAGRVGLEVVVGAFEGENAVRKEGVPAGERGLDHVVEDVLLGAGGGAGDGFGLEGGEGGGDGGGFEDVVGDGDLGALKFEEGGIVGARFLAGGALEDEGPVDGDGAGEALDAAVEREVVGVAGGRKEGLLAGWRGLGGGSLREDGDSGQEQGGGREADRGGHGWSEIPHRNPV